MLGARPSSTPLHHQCEGRPPAFQASRATRATNSAVASAACLGRSRGPLLHLRVHRAPGIPCALYFRRGKRTCKTRAKSRRGIAESYSELPSLRGAKRRSNPLLLRGNMDCFACARNDGFNTRHAPSVIARLDRAIQYSRGACDGIERPRRTGYPACAGYDDRSPFAPRNDGAPRPSAPKVSSLQKLFP
jgi:hypothetical protein